MFIVGRLIGSRGRTVAARPAAFVALAYSAYALGNLNFQIAPVNVIWPNVINGLATGFIFVPLTTSAMGMLRNEEIGNATGLYNLMRNIGAAAGIAMMTTFLARGAQVHQTDPGRPHDPLRFSVHAALAYDSVGFDAGQRRVCGRPAGPGDPGRGTDAPGHFVGLRGRFPHSGDLGAGLRPLCPAAAPPAA